MGQTVIAKTTMRDVSILQKTLQKIYGWNNISTLNEEDEQAGKDLETGGVYGGRQGTMQSVTGGTEKLSGQEKVVMVVKKKDLKDLKGRKAVWSDLLVVRNDDGTLSIVTDLHNFDSSDQVTFLDMDMINNVAKEYATTAIDDNMETVNATPVTEWFEDGEEIVKQFDVDEDVLGGNEMLEN